MNLKQLYQRYEVMIHNFSYMTLLKAITIVLPLVTFPYLIKVLGAEKYGLVMWAWAIAQIMIVVVKFGYDTLGVRLIAENINNKQEINRIVSQISFVKLFLFAVVTLFIFILLQFDKFSEHSVLFYIFIFFIFFESMFPVWYFQGIEKMKYIAIFSAFTKLFFALAVFVVISKENDYILLPILYALGSFLSLLLSIYILFKNNIKLVKLKTKELLSLIKENFFILFANLGTISRDKLTIILMEINLGLEVVAYLDLALKILNVLLTPFHIILQVVYPYVARTKNIIIFNKVLVYSILISVGVILIIIAFSDYLSLISNSNMFKDILIVLLFILPFAIVSSFLGNAVLIVFSKSNLVFISMVISIIIYLLLYLFVFDQHSYMSYAYLIFVSFLSEALLRFVIGSKIILGVKNV